MAYNATQVRANPPEDSGVPTNPQRPQARGRETTAIGKRLMSDLMRDYGVSASVAAGIVGSLAHESGNFQTMQEINPTVEGSRGGYGYAQWTGPRRKEYEAYVAANNLDIDSYEANYGNLRRELDETSEGQVMKALTDPNMSAGDAAEVFTNGFLRPGIPAMGGRRRYAEGYMGSDYTNYANLDGGPVGDKGAIPDKELTKGEKFANFTDQFLGGLDSGGSREQTWADTNTQVQEIPMMAIPEHQEMWRNER